MAGMQHAVLADVLGEVEFGAWDGGEGLFDYLPEVVADEFGALYISCLLDCLVGRLVGVHSRITLRKSSIGPG